VLPSAILRGAQQIHNVEVSVSTRWLINIPSSRKRSSPSQEMFVTPPRSSVPSKVWSSSIALMRNLTALLCTPIICTANIDWRAPSGFICLSI
jgi:hypothetical protein